MRTQVGIVGGGPAGLLLSHLLHLHGIESIVVETRSRAHTEQRVRAGVLEQGTVDLLADVGLGDRLAREGLVHSGIELRFGGRGHRIDLAELTGGATITVYGQQELQKDLNAARQAAGGRVVHEASDVRVDDLDGDAPVIRFVHADEEMVLRCDLVAGCDGFHGITRPAVAGALTIYDREYPFGWLGILARVAPASHELVYSAHERGFALLSMRSPEVSRLYLQCPPDAQVADWPDERVWEELHLRLAGEGLVLQEGAVIEKGVTAMRSFVAEPMRHGRLFLAGDAAHIVPPAGAKGLNLAVADVRVLAEAIEACFRTGHWDLLDAYSDTCLRRVWRVQHFSWWMTSMLHRFAGDDPFERRLQLAQLAYVTSSRAAATTLAENYVGLAMGSAA